MYETLKMVTFLECFDENETLYRMVFSENDIYIDRAWYGAGFDYEVLVVCGLFRYNSILQNYENSSMWYEHCMYCVSIMLHNLREKFDPYIIF